MRIKLYGERNTGTNYLQELIARNVAVEILPGVVPPSVKRAAGVSEAVRDQYFRDTFTENLGWKHAMAPGPDRLTGLGDVAGQVLFITLTKNPYSWLLSLHKTPYHAVRVAASFSDFLTTPWETVDRELTNGAFANPVDMWNRKNASYLGLGEYATCINMRYEDLLEDAERVVSAIVKQHALPWIGSCFVDVEQSTKRAQGKTLDHYREYYLQEKWRDELDASHVATINSRLDTDVAARFGYDLIA